MQSYLQYRRLRCDVRRTLEQTRRSSLNNESEKSLESASQNHVYPKSNSDAIHVFRSSSTITDTTSYLVEWEENDPENPQNWSLSRKWTATVICCLIGIAMTLPTSIEAPSQPSFNSHYGVSALAGSMTTGIFLIGIGVGSLFAGPFSETFGRNAVYCGALVAAAAFALAKALAPDFGSALAFRLLCALAASAPMTVAGGTIADVWRPDQIAFALPFATFCVYSGPILGPVIGAALLPAGFRWADGVSAAIAVGALLLVLICQPETYAPRLLAWKAAHFRLLAGDRSYVALGEDVALVARLRTNLRRPFAMAYTEPIILVFSFYLTLLYFVLFTFLGSYEIIFTQTYGISIRLTYFLWAAMIPGQFVALAMIPYIYALAKRSAARAMAAGKSPQPEVALYWSTSGASVLMPISLLWMAWTCYPHISIWSPIVASGVFGFALVCIFTTSYQYIIFVYMQYAASALGFMTFIRYVISGALTPAAIVMYRRIGPHWSLTIAGTISAFMAPVPYLLLKYGHRVRAMSRNVVNKA